MSYSPIFSEPTPAILKNSNRKIPGNNSFSKLSAGNGHSKARRTGSRLKKQTEDYSILVHCHLCWNWVWQRPQQFMSRLSRKHKVIFVETLAPDAALVTPVAR